MRTTTETEDLTKAPEPDRQRMLEPRKKAQTVKLREAAGMASSLPAWDLLPPSDLEIPHDDSDPTR